MVWVIMDTYRSAISVLSVVRQQHLPNEIYECEVSFKPEAVSRKEVQLHC